MFLIYSFYNRKYILWVSADPLSNEHYCGKKKTYRLPITPHSESILIGILWHLTDCFPFSSVTTAAGADGLPGRAARRETHTQSLKSDTHNAVCQEGINGVH